ncbi:protein of unknown function [Rhodococcus sp. RD6.2]|nr:protein of unknown function [Rhodococcus sp. RD6.2]
MEQHVDVLVDVSLLVEAAVFALVLDFVAAHDAALAVRHPHLRVVDHAFDHQVVTDHVFDEVELLDLGELLQHGDLLSGRTGVARQFFCPSGMEYLDRHEGAGVPPLGPKNLGGAKRRREFSGPQAAKRPGVARRSPPVKIGRQKGKRKIPFQGGAQRSSNRRSTKSSLGRLRPQPRPTPAYGARATPKSGQPMRPTKR